MLRFVIALALAAALLAPDGALASNSTGIYCMINVRSVDAGHIQVSVFNENDSSLQFKHLKLYDNTAAHTLLYDGDFSAVVSARTRISWTLALQNPLRTPWVTLEAMTDNGPISIVENTNPSS